MVRFLAERSDAKSNVKLGGFRPQLQASYISGHPEELRYNETVCMFFKKKLLLCDVSYIELFTRKIWMFIVEWFFVLTELFPIPV